MIYIKNLYLHKFGGCTDIRNGPTRKSEGAGEEYLTGCLVQVCIFSAPRVNTKWR